MLELNKIKAIGILRRKVFRNDDDYYSALSSYGVGSCKDLTERDAKRFIAQLHELNGDSKNNVRYSGKGKRGTQKRLTKEQAERIGILQDLLGWSGKALFGFIYKQTGKNIGPEMLMNYQAVKVIIGMGKVYCGNCNLNYKKFNAKNNTELIEILNTNNINKKAN